MSREAFSRALAYWAVEGKSWETRKEALGWIDQVAQRGDGGHKLVREGVRSWLLTVSSLAHFPLLNP